MLFMIVEGVQLLLANEHNSTDAKTELGPNTPMKTLLKRFSAIERPLFRMPANNPKPISPDPLEKNAAATKEGFFRPAESRDRFHRRPARGAGYARVSFCRPLRSASNGCG
ncbi:MAG TPA: hypothetical protein VGA56_03305, partial [Opitutaceae bacterium]